MDPAIPNKIHKVYPTHLLEKLNISNEIKSFPYLRMKTITEIYAKSLMNYKCTKYVVIHYCSSYMVQLSGKLHTIRHNELNMYSNFH